MHINVITKNMQPNANLLKN